MVFNQVGVIPWDGMEAVPYSYQTINGYHCRLYPCIKTFRANISVGQLKEEVLEEIADNIFSPIYLTNSTCPPLGTVADISCLTSDQRQVLNQLGYQFNDTTRWLPYNVSFVDGTNGTHHRQLYLLSAYGPCERAPANRFSDLCDGDKLTAKALEIVPSRFLYSFARIPIYSMYANLFAQMFTGKVRNAGAYGYRAYKGVATLIALYNAGSGKGTLEDTQSCMHDITSSLTTYMHQAGDEGFSESATGEMYEYASCVQVKWAWLAYTATAVGLPLIFFGWMVVHVRINQSRLRKQWTSRDTVPLIHDFKSSALSVLFHGLDRESMMHMENIGASSQEKEL
jgi:hypothetical protein